MKIHVHGKDVDVSPKTVELIEEKLEFLSRYLLIEEQTPANAVVRKVANQIRLEVTVSTKVGLLRAEVTDDDLKMALEEVVKRLETQLLNQKSRLNRRHKDKLALSFVEEEETGEDDIPVRTKNITVEEMSLDEAILRMEMLGHSFFIYKDEEAEKIAVVYARHDGGYGLIEVDE